MENVKLAKKIYHCCSKRIQAQNFTNNSDTAATNISDYVPSWFYSLKCQRGTHLVESVDVRHSFVVRDESDWVIPPHRLANVLISSRNVARFGRAEWASDPANCIVHGDWEQDGQQWFLEDGKLCPTFLWLFERFHDVIRPSLKSEIDYTEITTDSILTVITCCRSYVWCACDKWYKCYAVLYLKHVFVMCTMPYSAGSRSGYVVTLGGICMICTNGTIQMKRQFSC